MKRLLVFFLIIVGAIWLGLKIHQQPGYIVVGYKHWVIETTAWFLSLLILLCFLIFHLLLNLLRGIFHLPKRVEVWWLEKKQVKSMQSLNKAYTFLVENNFKKSEKKSQKSAKNKHLAFMSYLIAAQAADGQQAPTRKEHYLLMAKERAPKGNKAADIVQVLSLLKHNKIEEALSLLLTLRQHYPKDHYLLELLIKTYLELQDWPALQKLLKQVKRLSILNDADYNNLEKNIYLKSLQTGKFATFSDVQLVWNKIPRHLHYDKDILIAYAHYLNRWNRGNEAEKLLRKQLKKDFNPDLMEFYVGTPSNEPAKQLALGEKYLKNYAGDADAFRAMGIFCLRHRLWGQANDYLEKSLALKRSPKTFSALGYVNEKLGNNAKALSYYRRGCANGLAPDKQLIVDN